MRSAVFPPSDGSAASPPGAVPKAGPSPQMAYLVAPNPRFGVQASWWTGVVLQQACQALLGSRGG